MVLSTGVPELDEILDGGIAHPSICMIYGESGTGKTMIALRMAIHAARMNIRTMYLDVDLKLDPRALRGRFMKNPELLRRITVITGNPEVSRLLSILDGIRSTASGSGILIVIDTISSLIRWNIYRYGFKAAFKVLEEMIPILVLLLRRGTSIIALAQFNSSELHHQRLLLPLKKLARTVIRLERDSTAGGHRVAVIEKLSGRSAGVRINYSLGGGENGDE